MIGSVAFAALFSYLGYSAFQEAGPSEQNHVYLLKKGQGLSSMAREMEAAGLISSGDIFKAGVFISGYEKGLQAGEYAIPASSSMQSIMLVLASGQVVQHKFTIVEGWTSVQVVETLGALENLTGSLVDLPGEGSIMPQTYLYTRGTDRGELIRRMQARQKALLEDLWAERDDDLPFDTMAQTLILASIVEKETALPEERPHIAGVFVNRLNKSMRLQSDPTVVYGIDRDGNLDRPLSRRDLKGDTPYNTYKIRGLPPTAIAHPGAASIRAVMHPLETDDLYFVASGNGGHSFAPTLKEHLANVKILRRFERQKTKEKSK